MSSQVDFGPGGLAMVLSVNWTVPVPSHRSHPMWVVGPMKMALRSRSMGKTVLRMGISAVRDHDPSAGWSSKAALQRWDRLNDAKLIKVL